jgi:hypothetical protein
VDRPGRAGAIGSALRTGRADRADAD